ncbi:MAG TPA: F0F1 ATP synthase subunit B, partial [Ignavibacteriaceae bacterium]|nr:F0F1 ATP synthase subunit B [Ignavibacteriaceae bacterium]
SNMFYNILAFTPEGRGSLIDVNPGLIFWTVVTFLILLFILKKVAWKPILSALDQREASIRESIEKAEKAKSDAQKILDENKANLARAEDESRKLIEQSREYAEKMKNQILMEGKEQSKKIIEDAAAEIERKKDAAFSELKNQIADIALQAAEKLLSEKLDPQTHKKITDKYIDEITKN